ncbi:MAG: efflux transporter outer membrane subunit [Roseateles sp.]|uniref:efflux transporter outer membrane subunit n=1 Tax=Roseateles sp. TaxID=1971397 RepID=UPI0039E775FC
MRRLLGAAALALSGCALPPLPEAPAPLAPPAAWQDSAPAAAAELRADWWRGFGDAALDELVAQALAHNTDLLLAGARLAEARAALAASRAAEGPQLNAVLGLQTSRTLQPTGISESRAVQPGLAASWELDLWGRERALTRTAELRADASRAERDGMALSVAALTVQSYVSLRAQQAQLALARRTLDSRAEALRLAEDQARTGYISQLQLTQAQAEHAAVAQTLPALELAIRRQQQGLALLTGRPALDPPLPPGRGFDDLALPLPPAGLPSALLARRPDIAQAALQLAASDATLAARRAAFLPQLNLSASAGELYVSGLRYDPVHVWSLGASVLAPLFDAGRLRAQFDAATAQRDQAALAYRGRVLAALAEVENALAGLERLGRQRQLAQQRRDVLARSLGYAHDRYQAGYAGYLEELDAQRNLYAQDNELIRLRQAELDNQLALVRALGGGWRREP